MKLTGICFAGALSMITASSFAQTYLGVEGGLVKLNANTDKTAGAFTARTRASPSITDDTRTDFGRVVLGKRRNEDAALELGLFFSDAGHITYSGAGVTSLEKISAQGLDFSMRYHIVSSSFFLRGGIHYSRLHRSGTAIESVLRFSDSQAQSGTGFLAGFGYERTIMSSTNDFLSIEYKYYDRIGGDRKADARVISLGYRRQF